MRYKHGNFTSNDAEFGLRGFSRTIQRNERSSEIVERRVLATEFHIIANGQAAITARYNAIKAGLDRDGVDSGFLMDNGQPSAIWLPNSGSREGVQVVQAADLQPLNGADYATGHLGGFSVAAEYDKGFTLPNFDFDYSESVTIQGNNGAIVVPIVTDTKQVLLVTTALHTPVVMIQQGYAVGRTTWPLANPPLWPQFLVNPAQAVTTETPKRRNNTFTEFRVSWNYRFLADGPQSGLPLIR